WPPALRHRLPHRIEPCERLAENRKRYVAVACLPLCLDSRQQGRILAARPAHAIGCASPPANVHPLAESFLTIHARQRLVSGTSWGEQLEATLRTPAQLLAHLRRLKHES